MRSAAWSGCSGGRRTWRLWRHAGGVRRLRGWRSGCGGGGSGARWAPRDPCPAKPVYSMDLATCTSRARLPGNLRARLNAAEGARGGDADEQPLAPFPPQPESPPAKAARGEGERVQEAAVENMEEEEAYGPGELALPSCTRMMPSPTSTSAWTWTRRTRRCCPCPPQCRPLPRGVVSNGTAGSMRPRVPNRHRLTGAGRREAGLMEDAPQRYEFHPPGSVAR